tara:strand:+ start:45 stop:245 length:201 start_codon:yes stop_codon:yes gene_type:complete
MEGKKFKVRVNGQLTTDTFNSIQEAATWVDAFAKGVNEVVIESVDVPNSTVGTHEASTGNDDLLLG